MIHSLLNSNPLLTATMISTEPLDKIGRIENTTFITAISIRRWHGVQLITSAIALPILSIVGLLTATGFLLDGDKHMAKTTLKTTASLFTTHLLVWIPTSLMGIFVSHKTTGKICDFLSAYVDKMHTFLGVPSSSWKE